MTTKPKEEKMSAERMKVLEMLADKKITAEEANKLLEKLGNAASAETKGEEANSSSSNSAASSSAKPRYLHIVVDKPGQDQTNVRVPLAFARSGSNLLAVLPARVREKLAERGINLSEAGILDPKTWEILGEDTAIDIEKGNGKRVKIFCE
jgi:hypothetical protein